MNVEKLGGKTMTAKISVIMGSTSDWETMKEACQILDEFGVSYEKKVVSAHRTPDLMFEYAQNARKKESKSLLQEQGEPRICRVWSHQKQLCRLSVYRSNHEH